MTDFKHSDKVIIIRGQGKGEGIVVNQTPAQAEVKLNFPNAQRNVFVNARFLSGPGVSGGPGVSVIEGDFKGYNGQLVRIIPEKLLVETDNGVVQVGVSDVLFKDIVLLDNTHFHVDSVVDNTFIGRRLRGNLSEPVTITIADISYFEPGFSTRASESGQVPGSPDTDDSGQFSDTDDSVSGMEYTDFEDVPPDANYIAGYMDTQRTSASQKMSSESPIAGLVSDLPIDTKYVIENFQTITTGLNIQLQNNDVLFIVCCLVYFNLKLTRFDLDMSFNEYTNKLLNPRSEFGGLLRQLSINMETLLGSIFLGNLQGVPDLTNTDIQYVYNQMGKSPPDTQSIVRFILDRCYKSLQIWLNIKLEGQVNVNTLTTNQLRQLLSDINTKTIVSNIAFKHQVYSTLLERDTNSLIQKYLSGLNKRYANQPDTFQYITNGFNNPRTAKKDDPNYNEFAKYYKRFQKDRETLEQNLRTFTQSNIDLLDNKLKGVQI
ncbi:MAG: hypothetical protein EBU90_01855 [Proteobacteria bacterium]|nr:hypothetical protein [Pseudomonadota bacterium]NBP13225.1 hypothetical protein [bacterium]